MQNLKYIDVQGIDLQQIKIFPKLQKLISLRINLQNKQTISDLVEIFKNLENLQNLKSLTIIFSRDTEIDNEAAEELSKSLMKMKDLNYLSITIKIPTNTIIQFI